MIADAPIGGHRLQETTACGGGSLDISCVSDQVVVAMSANLSCAAHTNRILTRSISNGNTAKGERQMKRLALCLVVAAMCVGIGRAQEKARTFTGDIMDSAC